MPDADGFISGVRFYKGTGNTGTHTGTLWTASGAPLASGIFSNETASGWQSVTFSQAVSVTAGTTYVASYFAPSGRYAADGYFFTAADYHASPLTVRGKQSGVQNGVYATSHAFPTSSFQDTNYWVDVQYTRDDTTPPSVAAQSPLPNASSVATTIKPSATFAGSVDPATVTLTLKDGTGTAVPGSAAFDATTRTARFTPTSPLAYKATYTATVNASSSTGVPMAAPVTWSFTVAATDPLPGACPCSIWPDSATPSTPSVTDTGNVELGVKFSAEVDGTVSGVRFYKGAQNLGTHTGSLWSLAGVRLATVTFAGESSSGWQTASFTSPVAITGGTTYIVSYRAPVGGYAVTSGGLTAAVNSPPLHTVAGGGAYTYGSAAPLSSSSDNYWVDLVYTANDAAPTVASTSPGTSAANVNIGAAVSATFSGQIQSGTANLVVKASNGSTVAGTAAYSSTSRVITFTPTSPLAAGATYTATVSGAAALSGNLMAPFTWSFTTSGVNACPCTLFASTAVPATGDSGDASALELGVSFSSSINGMISGVRFYKSALNT